MQHCQMSAMFIVLQNVDVVCQSYTSGQTLTISPPPTKNRAKPKLSNSKKQNENHTLRNDF